MSEGLEASPPAQAREHWRPRYHVTGERNWINDPNGPIHQDGVYHLFYQANPREPFWGPPSWGHVSSTDLVTWTRHPHALVPGRAGPDAHGCWSGCARMIGGRPAIYYTAVVGEDDERIESVCRAWGSADLLHWEKDAGNPLVAGPAGTSTHGYHRDPFLWHDDDGWHMLLGSGTTDGPRRGQVLRYDSGDATSWTYGGVFFEAPRWHGPLDLGEHWECPQLLLDQDGAALIVSCQTPGAPRPLMHAVAFMGRVDGGRFVADSCEILDHGDVLYAPALCRDEYGRHLVWGWAQELLPADRQASLSHAGALSLPREIWIDGGRLRVAPAAELEALRGAALPAAAASAQMELLTTFTGWRGRATWTIADDAGATCVKITADLDSDELHVTVADASGGTRSLIAPLPERDRHELRTFLDGSLLEVFIDGDRALTTRVYRVGASPATVRVTRDGDLLADTVSAWTIDTNATPGPA